MKFRKKPVVIEAIQWNGQNYREICFWAGFTLDGGMDEILRIHTLEGTMEARKGDWIIRGVKGELYPCKPDIFEASYEPFNLNPHEDDCCLAQSPCEKHRDLK